MKAKTVIICSAIGLLLLFLFSLGLGALDIVNTWFQKLLTILVLFVPFFFFSGIFPALFMLKSAHKPSFQHVYIFSLAIYVHDIWICFLLFPMKMFNLPYGLAQALFVLSIIVTLPLVILHTIFFHKVGFFYTNTLSALFAWIHLSAQRQKEKHDACKSQEEAKSRSSINLADKMKSLGKKILTGFSGFGAWTKKVIASLAQKKKTVFRAALIAGCAILLLILVFAGIEIYKEYFLARIETIMPVGLTETRTVIEIQYKSDIAFVNPEAPGEILELSPHINGVYSIRGRTLVFTPDAQLPVSARYKVRMNTGLLAATGKTGVEGRDFEFNTRLMEVTSVAYFFNVNELTEVPEELVAEISFSLPVDQVTLAERIVIRIDGQEYNVGRPEISEQPNIVYAKVSGFEQGENDKKIEVIIREGIKPLAGVLALEKDFVSVTALAAKIRLMVESVNSYPVPGNTYVALKFNLPVNTALVRDYLEITPAIPFQISSEYRYVVLEAAFEPNKEYTIIA
ncbi:MAG: hypothetical protein EHM28_05920, partial [Spirochaetaceae bacterium]